MTGASGICRTYICVCTMSVVFAAEYFMCGVSVQCILSCALYVSVAYGVKRVMCVACKQYDLYAQCVVYVMCAVCWL
jgi:hypothetical protein